MKTATETQKSKPKFDRNKVASRTRRGVQNTNMVDVVLPDPEVFSPVQVVANHEGVNLNIWLQEHRARYLQHLYQYGAILFRGFDVPGKDYLTQLLSEQEEDIVHYLEATTPRKEVADKLYTPPNIPKNRVLPSTMNVPV